MAIPQRRNAHLHKKPAKANVRLTPDKMPTLLSDPIWRMNNLYFIVQKEADEENGKIIKFKLNSTQQKIVENLWYRNIVPKARQLGITTFACIYALDSCLFSDNFQAGIIAHTDRAAKKIFSDKIQFAYNNMPPMVKKVRTTIKESAEELKFENGSSILVSTSMRSGTLDFLHVSEFGKICAQFPLRAQEIITGSLPTVPKNGIVIVESTAEGREGSFYEMTMMAKANHDSGKQLTIKDYRLHFFPWFDGPDYCMDPRGVIITDKDNEYFDKVEIDCDVELSIEQRAWYCATRDADFHGDDSKMWQEYPSTVEECFQVSNEGCYYVKQFIAMRKEGRICSLPQLAKAPCWTFWDIGNSDGTAIWVMQKVGQEYRLINFYEAWGEPYSHAAKWLNELGLVFQKHYLPHDADHKRQGQFNNKSPKDMLKELMPGHNFAIVPVIDDINHGIQQVRDVFPALWIDEERCKEGIIHLESYRKRWDQSNSCWSKQPHKAGGHSEAADALRQFGQAHANGQMNVANSVFGNRPTRRRAKV